MKKELSISLVVLLVGSVLAIPSEMSYFEGSMVGRYGVEVRETSDLEHMNVVNLSLWIGVNGFNSESPYYNCGLTERMARIRCQIPVQNYEEIHQMGRTTMHSNLSDGYHSGQSQWYAFLLIWIVTFTINLRSSITEVVFTLETETDIIDLESNSSEITTMTESASFNYIVQATSKYAQDMRILGLYFTGIVSTVIIIVASVKMITDKPQ